MNLLIHVNKINVLAKNIIKRMKQQKTRIAPQPSKKELMTFLDFLNLWNNKRIKTIVNQIPITDPVINKTTEFSNRHILTP
jgi:hypothetical protein